MINLFFVVHSYSGVQTYTNELLKWLGAQSGIKVHKVNFNSYDHSEYCVIDDENIIKINFPVEKQNCKISTKKYFKRCIDIMYPILKNKTNIIFHLNQNAQVELGIEAKKRLNAHIIYTLHYLPRCFTEGHFGSLNSVKEFLKMDKLSPKMFNMADLIICVTKFAHDSVVKYYTVPEEKIVTIYNGYKNQNINAAKFAKNKYSKTQLGFSDSDRIILYVGRIDIEKGIKKLINTFIQVACEVENIRLVVVGAGELVPLMKLTSNKIGRISFTGELTKKQVKQLYKIADIGIIPSSFEQCSYVALEMMHNGLPIICSDVPGLKELFTNQESALIIPMHKHTLLHKTQIKISKANLHEAIILLLKDKALAQTLARNALKKWSTDFTASIMGQSTMKAYQKVLKPLLN